MRTNSAPSMPFRNASRRGNAKTGDSQQPSSRRTTVTLSAAAQEIVERFKSASGASTSAAIDQIIQRSEPRPSRLKNVNGFLVLSAPPVNPQDVRHATLEDIKRIEDEMDREYVERLMHRDRDLASAKRKTGSRQ